MQIDLNTLTIEQLKMLYADMTIDYERNRSIVLSMLAKRIEEHNQAMYASTNKPPEYVPIKLPKLKTVEEWKKEKENAL